jgi:hypothetical protein
MGLSNFLSHIAYPTVLASIGAIGFSIDAGRMMQFGIAAFIVGAVYRFRWLLTVQLPVNGAQMWGYVSIRQGEKWNICGTDGCLRTVSGPEVVVLWGATVLQLKHLSATHSQYLSVEFVNGQSEVIPGPTAVHMDRSIHKEIKVKDAVNLTESEVLVVYRDDGVTESAAGEQAGKSGQRVTRHVIHGPCLHVPKNAAEWTHQFSWHGSVSNDPASNGHKVKGAVKFTKLRVCPEQTYFDVESVRTKDDALISVKVMIFYRLENIDAMLQETHDPTADFVNSVSSDVIEFVAGKSFEGFKAATDQLNNLEAYRQLTSRAKGIGFEVTKVVFRGYGAPQRLQKMHDDAIERRTKLALERENEDQEQQLQDMKLVHEEERLKKRRQMELETRDHDRKLQRADHEAKQKEVLEERDAQLQHLRSVKDELGLSSDQLSSYLIASEQGPPGKLVQIVGADSSGNHSSTRSSFIIQDSA